MIYEYHCKGCGTSFDVVKPVADIDKAERCEGCGTEAERRFVPRATYFIGAKVEHPEYNPGLGCVVRNKSHKRDILKAKGLEEIGNEPVESIHKHYDKAREEKKEKAWAEVDRGWVGDGSS